MTAFQLYAVKIGESELRMKHVFRDAVADKPIRVSWSYYVASYNGQTILFDVGFRSPDTAEQWGITLSEVDKEVRRIFDSARVDLIFITHHHFDHLDNIDLHPDVPIIISHEACKQAREDGAPHVRERMNRENLLLVESEYVYDHFFTMNVIGGHTPGSSVISFTYEGQAYLITGDECYTRDNIFQNKPIGVYTNTERNEAFIREAHHKGVTPLPYHDITIFQSYPRVSANIVQII